MAALAPALAVVARAQAGSWGCWRGAAVERVCLEIARRAVGQEGTCRLYRLCRLQQAAAGVIYGQDSSRRCGGDSGVMTGTGRTRRGDRAKQEQCALVEADKGLHRIFTALHSEHEKIWGSD